MFNNRSSEAPTTSSPLRTQLSRSRAAVTSSSTIGGGELLAGDEEQQRGGQQETTTNNNSHHPNSSGAADQPATAVSGSPDGRQGMEGVATNRKDFVPIYGKNGLEVVDYTFIPGVLKPTWHFIIGKYIYVTDDFTTVVRKMTLLADFAASGAASFGAGWFFWMYQLYGQLSDLFMSGSLLLLIMTFVVSYISLRVTGLASDGVVLLTSVALAAQWAITSVSMVGMHGFLWVEFALIGTCMVLQVPKLPLFVTIHVLLTLVVIYNQSWYTTDDPPLLLLVPGTRHSNGMEAFIISMMQWFGGALGLVAIFFSFEEQKRQVRVANASGDLAQKIVFELRKYNTDKVLELVEGARGEGECNAALIESFEVLVENLEKYRPFLPNYLFLSEADSDDQKDNDDEEGELDLSGGESSVFQSATESSLGNSGMRTASDVTGAGNITRNSSGNALGLKPTAHAAPGYFQGLISYAFVELKVNEWFSPQLASRTQRDQQRNRATFTDTLFEIANASKASIHSMIGDRVQLSWNATHRVAQPGAKAATFLLKLKAALKKAQLEVAGACCSGVAEVHSVFSAATKQQALYVDAAWLPSLEGCYVLATKHQALVVDANTASGAEYEAEAQAIDCIRYKASVAPSGMDPATVLPGAVLGKLDLHPGYANAELKGGRSFDSVLDLDAVTSAQRGPTKMVTEDPTSSLPLLRATLVYELLALKDTREDDEWMYQLHQDAKQADSTGGLTTMALTFVLQGKYGQAAETLLPVENEGSEKTPTASGNGGVTEPIADPHSPPPEPAVSSQQVQQAQQKKLQQLRESSLVGRIVEYSHHCLSSQ